MVTPELFERFPSPAAMAKATLPELEALIRTTGFFHNKAKSIKGAAQKIIAEFNGQVPQTLAELITIPGAARKTANVVLGVSFKKAEGVVVDTHVFRISHRLGLAKGDTPQKVEQELMKVIPQDRWIDFSHQIIHHGRQVCIARKPMPWKTSSAMEEKLRFVFEYERDEHTMSELCAHVWHQPGDGLCVASALPAVWADGPG
jgi:endonuclease-3